MTQEGKETHHTAKGLAGPKRPDDERDVQVCVDPPALIAALQTAHIVLQLALIQLVDQISLDTQLNALRIRTTDYKE